MGKKSSYNGFATITLTSEWKSPVLAYLQGERVNWSSGGYCYLVKESKIHKKYPDIEADDWNAAEIRHAKDYPETPQPINHTGWLSPDGKFYGCSYAGHEGLADHLALQLYDNNRGSKHLERSGWIRLQYRGDTMVFRHVDDLVVTQAQIDALAGLFEIKDDKLQRALRPSYEMLLEMCAEKLA